MSDIKNKGTAGVNEWWRASSTAGSVTAASVEIDEWASIVFDVISNQNRLFGEMAASHLNNDVPQLAGFLAEAWHAGTYSIDAAAKGTGWSANLAKSTQFNSPDIQIHDGASTLQAEYQSKYYKDADKTSAALSDGRHNGYKDFKKLAPSDQIDDIRKGSHQHAASDAAKGAPARQAQSENYQHTAETVDGQIREGAAQSKPLSHKDAQQLAKEAKRGQVEPFSYAEHVESWTRLKEIGKAAGQAAALNLMLHALPDIVSGLQRLFTDEEYEFQDATGEVIVWIKAKGLKVGVDTFLKSAVAGLLRDAALAGKLGEAAVKVPGAYYAAAAVAGIEAAYAVIRCAQGKCTVEKATADSLKVGLRTAASTTGAIVGQMVPIPILGGLIGSFIAGAVVDAGIGRVENDTIYAYMQAMDETFDDQRSLMRDMFCGIAVSVDTVRTYDRMIEQYCMLIEAGERRMANADCRIQTSQVAVNELQAWIAENES